MALDIAGRAVDLTQQQLRAIEKWARGTPSVFEVRLFGSRARGDSKPTSDVDLAITMHVAGQGSTALGIYTALAVESKEVVHPS